MFDSVQEQAGAEFASYIFSITVGPAPILDINPQLVLPITFSLRQKFEGFHFDLLNELYGDIFITKATPSPIVVAQTPHILLNFLFMIRVSSFEYRFAFSNILTLAFSTCHQINDPITETGEFLLNFVCLSCISASKFCSFL